MSITCPDALFRDIQGPRPKCTPGFLVLAFDPERKNGKGSQKHLNKDCEKVVLVIYFTDFDAIFNEVIIYLCRIIYLVVVGHVVVVVHRLAVCLKSATSWEKSDANDD
jgi:hypothetical protein